MDVQLLRNFSKLLELAQVPEESIVPQAFPLDTLDVLPVEQVAFPYMSLILVKGCVSLCQLCLMPLS